MNSRLFLLFGLTFTLLACSTFKPVKDPASRHLLDPAVPYRGGQSPQPSLAIARPSLPAYLDRQQLVTRDGSGAVNVLENNLWSEPFDSGIARVTAANLSRLTGSTSILPVGDFISMDYTGLVELRVAQFDPDSSGNMVLECTWKVQPVKGGDTNFKSFRTEVPVTLTVPAMSGRITAMNEALARLARDIARSL
ncbi:putative lipoprotein YmbA [Prosthecobacter fusiformis]|uniref:Putative lipoprotein YmbA n=1 Tax=Prosthecobacter fusiformis TaxID=48464 RepID=A0A4R7S6G2_9BACT|nr:PqiC family protein [Prosthecobacter fusiformis]TDU73025.1 putative lipoprotein YmbA [Prosthecobacter fusiformis]